MRPSRTRAARSIRTAVRRRGARRRAGPHGSPASGRTSSSPARASCRACSSRLRDGVLTSTSSSATARGTTRSTTSRTGGATRAEDGGDPHHLTDPEMKAFKARRGKPSSLSRLVGPGAQRHADDRLLRSGAEARRERARSCTAVPGAGDVPLRRRHRAEPGRLARRDRGLGGARARASTRDRS